MEPTQIRLTIPDSVDPLYLTGPADSLLREIEASCAALISVRGKAIFLSGTSQEIEQLTLIFSHLIQMVESGSRPTLEDVKLLLDSTKRNANLEQTGTRTLFVTHKGKAIQPKTQGQIAYTKAIANNSITFGIGPAGTGRTSLAGAMAVAGSLLGVALNAGISFPVGKVTFKTLYPLSFREFLLAMGQDSLEQALCDADFSLMSIFSERFEDLLRTYYFVGGMPEAVSLFSQNSDFVQVRRVQEDILSAYRRDFAKHAGNMVGERCRMVFESLPRHLAKENKKLTKKQIS